jgi:carboxymethylenebutenolidase
VAAGLVATASASAAANVVETDVEIKTPDGTCDATFIHPKSGSHPGVLLWPDAFGLRPAMRDMAKRLAAEGYSVLVPNPYYRLTKAPFTDASKFDFGNPDDRAKLQPLMASVNAPGNPEKDAAAYVGFLDAQKEVNKSKKIGTQGYCMGGPLVMRTAASLPDRVGAGASFHGGGLVTDKPDSPHLLVPKMKAHMYIGIASNDDSRQPDAKDKLKEAFAAAHVPAEVEVYSEALHGWCVPDMPLQAGKPIYNKPDAERAWAKLLALYKAGL